MNGSPSPISIICSADSPASRTSVSKTASDMSALGCRWVSRGHIGQYRLHFAVVSTMYSTGSALNFGRRVTYPHRSLARFQARMVYLYCTCRAGRASAPAKLAEGAPMILTMTGASGLIGRRLLKEFGTAGYEIRVLSRHSGTNLPAGVKLFVWDPVQGPPPAESLRDAGAVVHLAGEPVAQRWSTEVKQRIRDSRVVGTRNLVAGLAAM